MALSKRQKTFLAIFLVGSVALIIDRLFLCPEGGPKAASADSYRVPADLREAVGPVAVQGAFENSGLASRLRDFWSEDHVDSEPIRNPFSLSAGWFDSKGSDGPRRLDDVGRFIQNHRLMAVVMDGQECYVLVDDQFLTPGQSLHGFRLVSVAESSVVFERQGKQAVLELADGQ